MKKYFQTIFILIFSIIVLMYSKTALAAFDPYVTEVDVYTSCSWTDTGCADCYNVGWTQECLSCDGTCSCHPGWTYYPYHFYENSCTGSWVCDNGGGLGSAGSTYDHTDYTCHYVTGVTAWSGCSAGSLEATAVTWGHVAIPGPGSPCLNAVPLIRLCGMCDATSNTSIYKNEGEIIGASNSCEWGNVQYTDPYLIGYDPYNILWNWKCKFDIDPQGDGIPSEDCHGLNSFIDIGLRIKDGADVVKIGVEEETNNSPLKIWKGGRFYSVGLLPGTEVAHPYATKARIWAGGSTKILINATSSMAPACCTLGTSVFPCNLCAP